MNGGLAIFPFHCPAPPKQHQLLLPDPVLDKESSFVASHHQSLTLSSQIRDGGGKGANRVKTPPKSPSTNFQIDFQTEKHSFSVTICTSQISPTLYLIKSTH